MAMNYVTVKNLANNYGAEKLRFFMPAKPRHSVLGLSYTVSSDQSVVQEARAVEGPHRMLADGYKMILRPLDDNYSQEEFYIADFESLSQDVPDEFFVMVDDEKIVLGRRKAA